MKKLIVLLILPVVFFQCGATDGQKSGKKSGAQHESPDRGNANAKQKTNQNVLLGKPAKEDFEDMETTELESFKNRGNLLYKKGKFKEASKVFREGLAIARKERAKNAIHLFLLSLYNINRFLNNNDKVILYAEELVDIEKQSGQYKRLAPILFELGKMYGNKCNFLKAIDYTSQASLFCLKQGHGHMYSSIEILTYLGFLHLEIENYQQAITSQYEALNRNYIFNRFNKLEYKKNAILIEFAIGLILQEVGQYSQSLQEFKSVLDDAKKFSHNTLIPSIMISIAKTKMRLGNYDDALYDILSSLELLETSTHSNKESLIRKALLVMGEIYLLKGNISKASILFNKVNDPQYLGLLELKKKNYVKSLKYFRNVPKLNCQSSMLKRFFAINCGIGRAYQGLGEYKEAVEYFLEAINIIEEKREKFGINLENSMTKALSSYHEKYFTEKMKDSFLNANWFGFWGIEPYEGLIQCSIALNEIEKAFKYSENIKGRALAEVIGMKYLDQIKEKSFLPQKKILDRAEELTYNLHYSKEYAARLLMENNMTDYAKVKEDIKKFKVDRNSFFREIRRTNTKYSFARLPLLLDFYDIQLKENETLIEFEITNETIYIFLVKDGKLEMSTVSIPRGKLKQLVNQFREGLQTSPQSNESALDKKYQEIGGVLFSILMGKVIHKISRNSSLIIVPDEFLATLPFEALMMNFSRENNQTAKVEFSEYLGNRFPIIYAQSAMVLTLLRILREHPKNNKDFLAVLDPIFSESDWRYKRISVNPKAETSKTPGKKTMLKRLGVEGIRNRGNVPPKYQFIRLKETGKIANIIKRQFGGNSTILMGGDCFEERLYNLKLDNYRFLVFATHGVHEIGPALVLNQWGRGEYNYFDYLDIRNVADAERYNQYYKYMKYDGYLTDSEILELETAAEVVMLIACQTGIGESVKGEGIMGLGRAFQFSGSQNILVSLWSVAEKPSVEFSGLFIEQIKKGFDPSIALFNTRRILQKKGYKHPFFWSPFILLGD